MYQNSPRNARACSSPLEAARSVLIDRLLDRSAESSPLVKDDLKLCEGPEARSLKCEIETCLAKRTAHLSLFGTATPKVHILLGDRSRGLYRFYADFTLDVENGIFLLPTNPRSSFYLGRKAGVQQLELPEFIPAQSDRNRELLKIAQVMKSSAALGVIGTVISSSGLGEGESFSLTALRAVLSEQSYSYLCERMALDVYKFKLSGKRQGAIPHGIPSCIASNYLVAGMLLSGILQVRGYILGWNHLNLMQDDHPGLEFGFTYVPKLERLSQRFLLVEQTKDVSFKASPRFLDGLVDFEVKPVAA